MELIKRFEPVWLGLVVIGALNWGLVGLFDVNLVEEIFGTGTVADVVYVIVGIAGLAMLPRLLGDLRVTGRAHPTGV
jgi:uncharacterized protein